MPLLQLLVAAGLLAMLVLILVEIRRGWRQGRGAKGPPCDGEGGPWDGVDGGGGDG